MRSRYKLLQLRYYYMHQQVYVETLSSLLTQRVCVFSIVLRTNNYFPKGHQLLIITDTVARVRWGGVIYYILGIERTEKYAT